MKERWKEIPDGNYEVSTHGAVRRSTPGHGTYPGRVLKNVLMGMGYYVVNPVVNRKNKLMYVHRLVVETFIGMPPDGFEINHIDGNKLNNVLSNLEYVTHQRNMEHAREVGLIVDTCVYSDAIISTVRKMAKSGFRAPAISKATGVSARHCRDIIKNKTRKSKCQ